jgi:DNA-binding NarL/FixJ family response regulator
MSALIAAQPGPLRDALQTLLGMMPQIEIVYRVSDASSMRETVVEHRPALVLLDTNLSEEKVSRVVRMIKADGVGSQCLVLADNVQQQQLAESAGADAALVKGFPAARLYEVIGALMAKQEA